MKYWIITYGCQMNESDSKRIASILEEIGYSPSAKIEKADLIVANMCSIRQSAVDRVYGLAENIKKLKSKNKKIKSLLTGCILKEDKEKLKSRFDLVLSIKDLPKWPTYLGFKGKELKIGSYLEIKPKYNSNFSVSIPISSGCNNFCSYCVVPFTRGRLTCRPYQEILEEVKQAVGEKDNSIKNENKVVSNGAREIWLLGENVNDYRSRINTNKSRIDTDKERISANELNFAGLLKMVNNVPSNFWIRFTSPHPANFSPEVIEAIAKLGKITPYLNLPLQSGDDEILRRMNRGYTAEEYIEIVEKIRQMFERWRRDLEKEVAISTDIIVGFPGETEKQFEQTARLMERIKFDMAYIAEYSPRPGTAAFRMKDSVPHQEKEKRRKILNEILKKTALEKNKKFIGKEIDVLVREKKGGFLIGKSRHYKTVKFQGKSNLIGQFLKVKITKATPWGLEGKQNKNDK